MSSLLCSIAHVETYINNYNVGNLSLGMKSCFLLFLFLYEVQSAYNIILVSGVQHNDLIFVYIEK